VNYAQLTQALQDYLQNDEATFVSQIPTIVRQAEDRIYQTCELPVLKANATSSMTGGIRFLSTPSDFLSVFSLALTQPADGGFAFLLEKEVAFLEEAFPRPSDIGQPRYYAVWDNNTLLLAPTPDQAYPVELHYFYKPPSIVDAGTSWLGTNNESALLYGCLVEAYTFMKGEGDMLALYQQRYNEALGRLKVLGEAKSKRDNLMRDEPRRTVS
jgi:hypothetical protein